MRTSFLLALSLALPGCGPLSPSQSCGTVVERLVDCDAYAPGVFGGIGEADDRARCVDTITRGGDGCRSLMSSYARCAADHRCAEIDEACGRTLGRLRADCGL